jgi:hypothetical protein
MRGTPWPKPIRVLDEKFDQRRKEPLEHDKKKI